MRLNDAIELDGYSCGFVDGLARRPYRPQGADDGELRYTGADIVAAFELGAKMQYHCN